MINALYKGLWNSNFEDDYKYKRNNELREITKKRDPIEMDRLWHEYFTGTQNVSKTAQSADYMVAADPLKIAPAFSVQDFAGNKLLREDFE